jgi:hypothetical protein
MPKLHLNSMTASRTALGTALGKNKQRLLPANT